MRTMLSLMSGLHRVDGSFGRGRRKPHVLIVIQNLPLRLDRRVRGEATALVGAGFEVSVICPKSEPTERGHLVLDGVHVYGYRAPMASKGVGAYVVEFLVCWLWTAWLSVRVNHRQRFDVLQACNPPDTYWLLGALWKVRGRAFVYDQHDLCPEVFEARFGRKGLLHRALVALEAATYRTADRVISPNHEYREIARRRGGLSDDVTTVVMSTPDATKMRRGQETPALRNGREHLVCYVGIMGPQDGVDHLLAGIDEYVHTLGRTDTQFALLGFGDSLEDLREECTARGLDDWVTFTGRVDHETISAWLSTADIGVTPDPPCEFNQRSTMNKTLEYMAHEVPVVATELRETRRCAAGAATYVSGLDALELAEAVAELADDPARRARMGALGRDRIVSELSWRHQAKAYVGVFRALVSDRMVPAPAVAPPSLGMSGRREDRLVPVPSRMAQVARLEGE